MLEANNEIREQLKLNGIALWQLADRLNCHESTLIRRFRHELPEAEKKEIFHIINEIKSGR